jgi:3-dehydroquinate synthase
METISIHGTLRDAKIYVGAQLQDIGQYLPTKEVFVLTDRNLYPRFKALFPSQPIFQVIPGDYSKSLRVATSVYRWLEDAQADRHAFLLGIGGGVVTDLAGFVACTYLRGIRLGLAPTTLLSQVDAAIGGKNALNLDGFKNMIGTVYQPEFILCDHTLLGTLSEEERSGGAAEMIKDTIIDDKGQFDYMLSHAEQVLEVDHAVLDPLIAWCIKMKKKFIEADEFDRNERRKLNFGHTWGHAVEAITGMHHGYAVSIGMVFATRFAVHLGICEEETLQALLKILEAYHLPTETKVLKWVVLDTVERDKKREDENINFIFPKRIGETVITPISCEQLREYVSHLES